MEYCNDVKDYLDGNKEISNEIIDKTIEDLYNYYYIDKTLLKKILVPRRKKENNDENTNDNMDINIEKVVNDVENVDVGKDNGDYRGKAKDDNDNKVKDDNDNKVKDDNDNKVKDDNDNKVKDDNDNKVNDIHNNPENKVKSKAKTKAKAKAKNIKENKFNDLEIDNTVNIINLTEKQQKVFDLFVNKKNIFITGPAGSGKSAVIHKIVKYARENDIKLATTSTTGSSALLINGKTIHSFLGFNHHDYDKTAKALFYKNRFYLSNLVKNIRSIDAIIIDEVSMLDDVMFEKISNYLIYCRNNYEEFFGGIQMIFSGDFCQLAPVNGEYCFKSSIWNSMDIETVFLDTMIRQDNSLEFQEILRNVRYGNCTREIYNKLSSVKTDKAISTSLFPINRLVDEVNKKEFDKLLSENNPIYKFELIIPPMLAARKKKTENWIRSLNFTTCVELCIGAQVIVTVNISSKNTKGEAAICNGTTGKIIKFNDKSVEIQDIRSPEIIHVIKYHQVSNADDNLMMFYYMPLKLAYALSIHKSQGMTLSNIEIDIGNSIFADGQAYTALSRVKDLDSITIKNVSPNSFKVNKDVYDFYKKIDPILSDK
jgi:DNA replication protein DnaC